jgi:hypothetical protein
MICTRTAIGLTLVGLVACSRGEKKETAAASDSLQRDLQLAPTDTTQPLADRSADTATTPPPAARDTAPTHVAKPKAKHASKPAPKPKPKAAEAPPAYANAPAAPAAEPKPAGTDTASKPAPASLDVGTTIPATMVDSINSRSNKPGDKVTAKVDNDVRDAAGRVVIPAGSTVTLTIADIRPSPNKSDNKGTLRLEPTTIMVDGKPYPIAASVDSVDSKLVGRATNINDVAKVGAGTGIGAIAGKILGGGTGAVIGGVVGGAVGTQRAVETKDRDVEVTPGSTVRLRLRDKFIATS